MIEQRSQFQIQPLEAVAQLPIPEQFAYARQARYAGEWDVAAQTLTKIIGQKPELDHLVAALLERGVTYKLGENFEAAKDDFQWIIDNEHITAETRLNALTEQIDLNLVMCVNQRTPFTVTSELANQGRNLHRELRNNPNSRARLKFNLLYGRINNYQGDYSQVLLYTRKVIEQLQTEDPGDPENRSLRAQAYQLMGVAFLGQHRVDGAQQFPMPRDHATGFLQQAHMLFTELGDRRSMAASAMDLGELYAAFGEREPGSTHYKDLANSWFTHAIQIAIQKPVDQSMYNRLIQTTQATG